ncbi:WapI family immunity protein [Quadrisphaera granulorum]|uniref:WapI family immunity protein n=1 Tax=Quadrisphaera granulorum TaxID=317664 RepID=UPI0011B62971|nr:hypothetical protein [Quadrisphaera granulorum]
MILRGDDGAEVELRLAGYQFPDATVDDDGDEWDANWLLVAGRVRTARGTEWSFVDPALTTWEVAEVADWWERAGRGQVAPATAWEDDDGGGDEADGDSVPFWWDVLQDRGWLVFLEPCLSLGVGPDAARGGDEASAVEPGKFRILVGLGAEWAPPPFPEQAHDWCCVELRLTQQQLYRAAADLREELATYPRR